MIVIVPAWKNSVEGDLDSWVRRYKAELAASLKDAGVTTGEQIKSGIQRLRRSGSPFLPSPGGFSSYCMKKSDSWQHNTGAYHVFDRKTALPSPKAYKKTAGKHIAGMRSALTKQR